MEAVARQLDRAWQAALLAGLIATPLVLGGLEELPGLVAHGVVVVLLLACLLAAALRGDFRAAVDELDLAAVAYLALTAAACVTTVYLHASLVSLFAVADCLVVFWLVRRLAGSQSGARLVAWSLCLGGAIVAIIGLREYLRTAVVQGDQTWRAFATFFNPNLFGGYLVLVIPVAAALALGAPRGQPRLEAIAGTAVVALSLAALMVTGSKGALLGLLLGAALLGALIMRRGGRRSRARLVLVLGGAFALLIAVALLAPPVRARLSSALTSQRRSGAHRYYTWVGTCRMVAARPLLGHGPGVFPYAYPQYAVAAYTRMAHQAFLQVAAEAGAPAALALLAWLGLTLRRGCRDACRADDGGRAYLLMGGTGAVLGFVVHGMVDYNWHVLALAVAAGACLGLLCGRPPQEAPSKRARKDAPGARPAWLPLALVCAGAALALSSLWPMGRGAAASARADRLLTAGQFFAGKRWRHRATEAYHLNAQAHRDLGKALASGWRMDGNRRELAAALRSVRTAARLQPTDGVNYFLAGKWRLEAGDARGAAAALQRAVQVYPTYTEARNLRAEALRELGDTEGALAEYREIARLFDTPLRQYPATDPVDPTFGGAMVALAREACRAGNYGAVGEHLERAKRHLDEYFAGLRNMEAALKLSGRWDQDEVDQYDSLRKQAELSPQEFCAAHGRDEQ